MKGAVLRERAGSSPGVSASRLPSPERGEVGTPTSSTWGQPVPLVLENIRSQGAGLGSAGPQEQERTDLQCEPGEWVSATRGLLVEV